MLADFIVERSEVQKHEVDNKKWVLKTDGSSRAQGKGAGIILKSSDRPTIAQAIKLAFTISNNETEYKAVILGLTVAKYLSIVDIDLWSDSQLVAVQLRGEHKAKNERMEQYLQIAKPLLASFKRIEVTHVPRIENQMVDALANLATNALHPCNVKIRVMEQPSIPVTPLPGPTRLASPNRIWDALFTIKL